MNYEGYCKTDSKGHLYIYNRGMFEDFFRENPSSDFILTVKGVSKEPSNRLFAFYHSEVLPKLIEGFRNLGENHNKGTVAEEMKKHSPVMWHFELIDGRMEAEARDFEQLNYFERKRHIDECIIFAATNLDIEIEEPK